MCARTWQTALHTDWSWLCWPMRLAGQHVNEQTRHTGGGHLLRKMLKGRRDEGMVGTVAAAVANLMLPALLHLALEAYLTGSHL